MGKHTRRLIILKCPDTLLGVNIRELLSKGQTFGLDETKEWVKEYAKGQHSGPPNEPCPHCDTPHDTYEVWLDKIDR